MEVERRVAAGYASRLSPAACTGAPWVSTTFVVYDSKPRLVTDLRISTPTSVGGSSRTRSFHRSCRRSSRATTTSPGTYPTVVAPLRLRGYKISAYVDDFNANGRGSRPSSKAAATAGRVKILSLFQRLGIQVHPSKGIPVGSTCLPLLGYLVNTARQLVLLPPP